MRRSKFFIKTRKEAPSDETSANAVLLTRGGFVDKLMAGVWTLLPLGFRVVKKIEQLIREEMNGIGGLELFMPSLQPKELWQATGRWDTMDDLFRIKVSENRAFALGPTHEEVIAPLIQPFILSYKDLPLYLYQFQNKFRNEKRAKSGLLRGREFLMKDLYSFHADQQDLGRFYERVKNAYFKIFKRLGLGKITYLTYAGGGSFSKYSHEFQVITPAGEDVIYLCSKCKVGVNREIIEEQKHKCPECGSSTLEVQKAIEVGNIFKLGNRFSEPFSLSYRNRKGQKQPVIMGSYGIGLQRVMGAIVEAYHDEQGIIWPESVAPFKVYLISPETNKRAMRDFAKKVYRQLTKAGIEVLYDDRGNVSAGEKFADADLIGCPWRVVVSQKTLAGNKIELKPRNSKQVKLIKLQELIKYFKKNKIPGFA